MPLTCDKILYHFRYEIYMFAYRLFLMDVEFCHLGNCLKTCVLCFICNILRFGKVTKNIFLCFVFFCYHDWIFI